MVFCPLAAFGILVPAFLSPECESQVAARQPDVVAPTAKLNTWQRYGLIQQNRLAQEQASQLGEMPTVGGELDAGRRRGVSAPDEFQVRRAPSRRLVPEGIGTRQSGRVSTRADRSRVVEEVCPDGRVVQGRGRGCSPTRLRTTARARTNESGEERQETRAEASRQATAVRTTNPSSSNSGGGNGPGGGGSGPGGGAQPSSGGQPSGGGGLPNPGSRSIGVAPSQNAGPLPGGAAGGSAPATFNPQAPVAQAAAAPLAGFTPQNAAGIFFRPPTAGYTFTPAPSRTSAPMPPATPSVVGPMNSPATVVRTIAPVIPMR